MLGIVATLKVRAGMGYVYMDGRAELMRLREIVA